MNNKLIIIPPEKMENNLVYKTILNYDEVHNDKILGYCRANNLYYENFVELTVNGFMVIMSSGNVYELWLNEEIDKYQKEKILQVLDEVFNTDNKLRFDIGIFKNSGDFISAGIKLEDKNEVIKIINNYINKEEVLEDARKKVRS